MDQSEQAIHSIIRGWIVEIISHRSDVVALAMAQRAKFEGWLKFELADAARRNGAANIRVEPALSSGRADVGFDLAGTRCVVELKTPNTSDRMSGVENRSRPTTMNFASVVADAEKLGRCGGGVIAFVLFPLKPGSARWLTHLERVSDGIGRPLIEDEHVARQTIQLPDGAADVAVVTFEVAGEQFQPVLRPTGA